MAEQKNIRRKDTKDFNYDKFKAKQEKKRREQARRAARQRKSYLQ
jgi:hypothetical protein